MLDEDGHKRRRADRADEQVVQDGRQRSSEHEGVGAGRRAERRGNDHVADQAQATAQDVAQRDDRGGARHTPSRAAGDVATLICRWRYWRGLHVAALYAWKSPRLSVCTVPSTGQWPF